MSGAKVKVAPLKHSGENLTMSLLRCGQRQPMFSVCIDPTPRSLPRGWSVAVDRC
jgi:hypothetical protein